MKEVHRASIKSIHCPTCLRDRRSLQSRHEGVQRISLIVLPTTGAAAAAVDVLFEGDKIQRRQENEQQQRGLRDKNEPVTFLPATDYCGRTTKMDVGS